MLLDADVIIWWATADRRLGSQARALLESTDEPLVVSLLTIFEIELKVQARKLRLPASILTFIETFGIEVYTPRPEELRPMLDVRMAHADSFDRTFVGLARLKGWPAMTSDDLLLRQAARLVTMIDSKK
jgi:PIN domain nuclease of toxin-antitoxin system